jgi:ABC-2 type transport system permease protein
LNWKTLAALLARDVHVARRNLIQLLLQILLQPLLFTFVFGRVMTASGMMAATYKSLLLPGIMAICMLLTGIQSVAMPLIAEFQFSREIEDRLLAPIVNRWLAVEKVIAGAIQALAAGLVVLPAAWLLMGSGVAISFASPLQFVAMCLLIALLSASFGLALGCSVGQSQIGLMFTLVIAPMMMFGCAYYPWSALSSFRPLQIAVLINPLVYASEGLRGTLAPQFPHMPAAVVLTVLVVADLAVLALGLNRFDAKSVN